MAFFYTRRSVVRFSLSVSFYAFLLLVSLRKPRCWGCFYICTHLQAHSHVPLSCWHPLSGSVPAWVSPFPNTSPVGKQSCLTLHSDMHEPCRHKKKHVLSVAHSKHDGVLQKVNKSNWFSYQKNTSQKCLSGLLYNGSWETTEETFLGLEKLQNLLSDTLPYSLLQATLLPDCFPLLCPYSLSLLRCSHSLSHSFNCAHTPHTHTFRSVLDTSTEG